MRVPLQLTGLAGAFVLGLVLAGLLVGGGRAQEIVTDTTVETVTTVETAVETETTVATETTVTTETLQEEPTGDVTVPATAAGEETESETPAWMWALIALLAVGLLVAIVLLARRGRGSGIPAEQRRRRLEGAVASWVGQGWALESETGDSAVLRRGSERMIVSVDGGGHISTQPLSPG